MYAKIRSVVTEKIAPDAAEAGDFYNNIAMMKFDLITTRVPIRNEHIINATLKRMYDKCI